MSESCGSDTSYVLKIDYREQHIIKQIQQKENVILCDYSIENLPIGDFIICKKKLVQENEIPIEENETLIQENQVAQSDVIDNIENPIGEDIIFIIERKTISDLCASITDARFREQKTRLFESVKDPYKIIYIIEGSKKTARLSKKIIDSALLNLVFKHHYHVLFTTDIHDTIDTIKLLYEKVKTNIIDLQYNKETKHNTKIEKISSGKLLKKSDSIQHNIFVHQLAIIPGVSIEMSKKIQMVYPTISELLNALRDDAFVLKDISITPKRKLGKKLSEKIYSSFFG